MASSATVTSGATARRNKEGVKGTTAATIRLNEQPAEGPEPVNDELQRDPIEHKYKDFFWTYTEEPHRTRRLAIIKAHPEVSCGAAFPSRMPPAPAPSTGIRIVLQC